MRQTTPVKSNDSEQHGPLVNQQKRFAMGENVPQGTFSKEEKDQVAPSGGKKK